MGQNILVI